MMVSVNPMNVYSGSDAIRKYFDPDFHPPLPLVEIPRSLNPFYEDGVRIYGKMMSTHPANNVKIMPAMNMLAKEVQPGNTKTVVEYSSGSTVISLALASRIYHGIQDTQAYLSNKTTLSKIRLMQFFGLKITLFGGPAQPEAQDERGGIYRARSLGQYHETILNPNQYENDANWQAHIKWTGPQIHKQLPSIDVICAGMGTSGTMTGIGQYFKKAKPRVKRIGVCTAAGNRVPGPRPLSLLQSIPLPWKDSVDVIEEVGSKDAFKLSLQLCREGLVCGPSSGLNLKGLLDHLQKCKTSGTLLDLAGPDQVINCVFICCDLPYQYIDEYFSNLSSDAFYPIHNENLAKVDLHRYDETWEIKPEKALAQLFEHERLEVDSFLIDLRQSEDFSVNHFPGSHNLPLHNADFANASPFFNPAVLESQWKELEAILNLEYLGSHDLFSKSVYVICYTGDTARVATSILRAKGIAAWSVKGGFTVFQREISQQGSATRGRNLDQRGSGIAESAMKDIRSDSLSPETGCRIEAP